MDAKRDANQITTLLALSNVDGVTPVTLWADPVTHRLLVDLAAGNGTVTSVSIVTANGVSGSVAMATTTPAITLTLGAITPTSVNGLPLSAVLADFNTRVGVSSGTNMASGATFNTFIGYSAGTYGATADDTADSNSGLGAYTLYNNTTGNNNCTFGVQSLYKNTTGSNNSAYGVQSLFENTTGVQNTGYGVGTLYTNSTGSRNVAIGYNAGKYETGSDAFYVDNRNRTNTAGDKAGALLYGTFNATPASQTLTVNATLTVAQTLELGHATDTTLSRVSAGVIAVEGVTIPTISSTSTLTNKRITQRVVTTTDDATAVIDVDVTDQYQLTAVANDTTFSTTGTPTAGQKLMIRFKDAGTAKALTWDAVFNVVGVTLPTTTVAGKTHYVGCVYNATSTKWDVLAVAVEA